MREKLIELICSTEYGNGSLIGNNFQKGFIEKIADHLIANGVTIQKWIPVSERLPEKREDVLLCRKWWNEIQNPQMGWHNDVSGEWFDLSNRVIRNVTHWMPLPEPPKEE